MGVFGRDSATGGRKREFIIPASVDDCTLFCSCADRTETPAREHMGGMAARGSLPDSRTHGGSSTVKTACEPLTTRGKQKGKKMAANRASYS
jgi:hypothetical protein